HTHCAVDRYWNANWLRSVDSNPTPAMRGCYSSITRQPEVTVATAPRIDGIKVGLASPCQHQACGLLPGEANAVSQPLSKECHISFRRPCPTPNFPVGDNATGTHFHRRTAISPLCAVRPTEKGSGSGGGIAASPFTSGTG